MLLETMTTIMAQTTTRIIARMIENSTKTAEWKKTRERLLHYYVQSYNSDSK